MACCRRLSLSITLIIGFWLIHYFLSSAYIRFIRPPTSWKEYEGEWAIVSGASYGLGASYAKSLASRNINVALVSRSQSKLEEVEKELKKLYPKILTKIIVVDLTKRESYKKIKIEMEGLEVSILVLNAGGCYGDNSKQIHLVDFGIYEEDGIEYDVNLNFMSPIRLSRVFLESMTKRNKGRILAVSSIASVSGIPFMSIYSASKIALEKWAISVRAELSILNYDGVQIMVTVPAGINTPLITRLPHSLEDPSMISPDTMAENDLNLFGCETVFSTSVGHSVMYHISKFLDILPTFVQNTLQKKAYISLERIPIHRIRKDEL